jgi:hypothetical protein
MEQVEISAKSSKSFMTISWLRVSGTAKTALPGSPDLIGWRSPRQEWRHGQAT